MAAHSDDAALETLFAPFATGLLAWPEDRALFMRARAGSALPRTVIHKLECEQTFKPDAEALQRAGCKVISMNADATANDTSYPLVLLLPPRQREEARALMARAVDHVQSGGRVIACMSNNDGARSSEADLARLVGPVQTMTKNKCRVFWSTPLLGASDVALASQWRQLDAARPIANGHYVSRPGVFAWDRIDPASALLVEHLPSTLKGRAADLGAGFGYLAVELLTRCPNVTAVDLYEAEARALDLARTNLSSFEQRATLSYHWHDVTTGLARTYDVIVTNPPFHTGHGGDRPDIGRRFIATAAEALKPGGRLLLVANRHLPYEAVLTATFGTVRTVTQQGGFKIIEAVKSNRIAR